MLAATIASPTHKFIYPLAYFFVLLAVFLYRFNTKPKPRKLNIEEQWKIADLQQDEEQTDKDAAI